MSRRLLGLVMLLVVTVLLTGCNQMPPCWQWFFAILTGFSVFILILDTLVGRFRALWKIEIKDLRPWEHQAKRVITEIGKQPPTAKDNALEEAFARYHSAEQEAVEHRATLLLGSGLVFIYFEIRTTIQKIYNRIRGKK